MFVNVCKYCLSSEAGCCGTIELIVSDTLDPIGILNVASDRTMSVTIGCYYYHCINFIR